MSECPKHLPLLSYIWKVNATLYPGLIDAAEEWVTEGWGAGGADEPMLATAIINQANDPGTTPLAREQMLTVASNILNFYYRGDGWTEKPLPQE